MMGFFVFKVTDLHSLLQSETVADFQMEKGRKPLMHFSVHHCCGPPIPQSRPGIPHKAPPFAFSALSLESGGECWCLVGGERQRRGGLPPAPRGERL